MKRLVCLLASVLGTACATVQQQPADLVLTGGRVFTGSEAKPWAQAVAIRGDVVAAVGTDAEIRALTGPATRIVELEGRLVIPGINDAHVHVPWPSQETKTLALPQEVTKDTVLQALRAALPETPAGTVLSVDLPASLVDAGITRDDLDGVSTTVPIRAEMFGGHSVVLNTPALRAWGIAEDAMDPPGGSYGRSDGRLNGWVYEHALWAQYQRHAETVSDEALRRAITRFEDEVLPYGITSVQTMPIIPAERLETILANAPPRLRWRIMDMRRAPYDGRAGRHPVKYILDGTPIERSAAMSAAYADAPSTTGQLNYTPTDVEAMVRDAARGERQLLVHAVGDRAIGILLEAMRRTPADWPRLRVRIEHGDMITPAQVALARELGVVLVQNPAHFTIPEVMGPRYGAGRASQPARSLIAAGNRFAIGSDGPLNPYLNMFFAAIHPVNPAEALTVEQTLRGYTSGAAAAEFAESRKGTLAPGMLADLAVLSQDIFAVPPGELPKTACVMTIIGGKVVWETR